MRQFIAWLALITGGGLLIGLVVVAPVVYGQATGDWEPALGIGAGLVVTSAFFAVMALLLWAWDNV